ncbi:MAG TPA: PspC domain-containing protein [Acidimicrobiia bacterium]|jgi:phage shock protein PspC (stress-responsive transcriptional regulator)|nr:PspC domain-containing protein [Acidimicrobiia bacterium]
MDTTMTPPNPSSPPPGASSASQHPLTRSRTDRMIAGVAGGIARKYDFDPAIVRVAFVMLTPFTFGVVPLAYIVAWLVVPEADADEPVLSSAVHRARRRPVDRRLWLGLLLLFLGAEALAGQYGWHLGVFSHVFWPLVLIGIGASVLLLRERPEEAHAPPTPEGPRGGTVPVAPPPAPPSGAPASSESPGSPSSPVVPVAEPPAATGTGVDDDEPTTIGFTAPAAPPTAYPPSLPWPDPPRARERARERRRRARRERSLLGRLTWSVMLMVVGGAWLLDVVGAVDVDARFVVALELAIVGAALLAGAWFGRARGLIAIGIVLAVFAGVFSILDVPLRGPIGETIVRPQSLHSLRSSYELGIGHLLVDLGDTASDGRAHHVDLRDTIGFLEVRVPENARVKVIAKADSGELDILGRSRHGGTHFHKTVIDEPAGTSGPLLVIDAHVGFGSIRVTRAEGFTS